MSDQVDVSVAIATVDRPAHLARCLDEILQGETVPAEILVVDQGNNPETAERVQERQGGPVLVRWFHQREKGLSVSRNAALRGARCPVLAVTDDDCVPDSQWLAAISRVFALSPELAAVTGRILPLGPESPHLYPVSSRTSTVRRRYRGKMAPWGIGSGANTTFRREWIERIGPYDERLGAGTPGGAGEDVDLIYRLLRAGGEIQYEPDAVVYHERHTWKARRATRSSYGSGVGTFCALHIKQGDVFVLWILVRFIWKRLDAMGRALLAGQTMTAYEHALFVQGIMRGLIHGLRV